MNRVKYILSVLSLLAVISGCVRTEGNKMDVVSLESDPEGLFSEETGIYATGPYRLKPFGVDDDSVPGIAYPYKEANFWQKWWRPAHVTFLPREGEGFSADCGVAIFGGYSRALDKKSLKLKFCEPYASSPLCYRLFPNRDCSRYETFVLRAGSDAIGTLIKDDLVAYLADGLMDVQATRPAVLYINGQYFGIYFIREKIDEGFVANHHGIPTDSLDMVQGNQYLEAGTMDDWDSLLAFFRSHDLSQPANYQYVAERMDLQSYADWLATEIWCDNPDIGNVRCFKSPFLDNKWHWILYDVDQGFNDPASDAFLHLFEPFLKEDGTTTDFAGNLVRNPDFRALFLSRLEYQMRSVYDRMRVRNALDYFMDTIKPEVRRNHKRWNMSYARWRRKIRALYRFAARRQACLKRQFETNPILQDLLHMSPEELERCFPEAE